MKVYRPFFLFFVLIPLVGAAQVMPPLGVYKVSSENSLLLPRFDTSAIVNSDVTNIILSLYVLGVSNPENSELQLTVNRVDLKNRSKFDGISIFRIPEVNEYLDISLPRELFERMMGKDERLLLQLVDPTTSVTFAGINDATTDPKLTIETADVETPRAPSISLEGIGEIKNSTIIFNTGNGTVKIEKVDDKPWWLTYMIFPLVVALIAAFLIHKFGWNKIQKPLRR